MTRRPVVHWLILLAIASPILCLLPSLINHPKAWSVWSDGGRLISLIGNSLALAALMSLIAIPPSILVGTWLARSKLIGEKAIIALMLISAMIPLPVFAVAWQIVLGHWLPSLALDPGQIAWRPWQKGLLPAAFVHAIAGMPWLVLLTMTIMQRIDNDLEDAAIIDNTRWRFVLWPKCKLAIVALIAWMTAIAFTEIAVTDAMMVRTFAEDVYTELVTNPYGVPAAIATTVPVWIAMATMAILIFKSFRWSTSDESTRVKRRPASLWQSLIVWLIIAITSGLPLVALLIKASSAGLLASLSTQLKNSGMVIVESVTAAIVTGIITAILAWIVCVRGRKHHTILIGFAVVLWLLPGPLLGFGFKEWIRLMCDLEEWLLRSMNWKPDYPIIRSLLYDQPSPVPAILTAIVRFFPVAIAVIMPSVRAIPKELLDQATIDGLSPVQKFHAILRPLTGPAVILTMIVVTILSLGEVSASKLVNPPARRAYILDLFNQMHYGAEATVAALCLVQIAITGAIILVASLGSSASSLRNLWVR